MTSIGPYSEAHNFTHMFFDSILPEEKEEEDTLLYEINKNFKYFKKLVKVSNLEHYFNLDQNEYTLFIPTDEILSCTTKDFIENIEKTDDISLAKSIVKGCMISRKIPFEVLSQSNASFYYTENKSKRLFITIKHSNIQINNCVNVSHICIHLKNGIIYLTDNLII